ncbi:unnamed protein product, partial [Closterium sp. NIES-54]
MERRLCLLIINCIPSHLFSPLSSALHQVLSPFAPSDKLGIKSVQMETEMIVPMREMKMDWIPYIPDTTGPALLPPPPGIFLPHQASSSPTRHLPPPPGIFLPHQASSSPTRHLPPPPGIFLPTRHLPPPHAGGARHGHARISHVNPSVFVLSPPSPPPPFFHSSFPPRLPRDNFLPAQHMQEGPAGCGWAWSPQSFFYLPSPPPPLPLHPSPTLPPPFPRASPVTPSHIVLRHMQEEQEGGTVVPLCPLPQTHPSLHLLLSTNPPTPPRVLARTPSDIFLLHMQEEQEADTVVPPCLLPQTHPAFSVHSPSSFLLPLPSLLPPPSFPLPPPSRPLTLLPPPPSFHTPPSVPACPAQEFTDNLVKDESLPEAEKPKFIVSAPTTVHTMPYRTVPKEGKLMWVDYSVKASRLEGEMPPTKTHIHPGRKGENNPVLLDLPCKYKQTSASEWLCEGAMWEDKWLSKSEVEIFTKIGKHPNAFYGNIHTKKYPDGAVRGQFSRQHLQPLAFPLTHKFKSEAHHGKARGGLVTVRWEVHMAAVQRDLRRVRRGNRRLQSGDDDEEVVFGLVGNADPQIAGLYFASVALGSPPQLFNVQVDTGSDLLWVACQPCLQCATRSQVAPLNPPFNASQSSSNHLLPCGTRECPRYHLSDNVLRGCPSPAVATAAAVPAATCLYMLRYADGSASVGVLMRDVLHLPWTPSEQPVGPGGVGTGESGPAGNGRSGDLPSTATEPLGGGAGGVAGVARTSGNLVTGESGESGNPGELNIVEPRRIGQEVAAQRAAPASGAGGAASNGNEAQGSSVAANRGDETQRSGANASASGTKYRPVVTFGCGFNQSGNLLDGPLTVDGVMGLGRGASSLLAQLGAQHALPHAFAHCLGGPEGGGALFLGRVSSAGALSGVRGVWQQTALWDKPDSTQYMIGLAGIAIAGVPIAWQPAAAAAVPAAAAAAAARDAEAAAAAAAQTTSSLAAPAGNATGSASSGSASPGSASVGSESAGMVPCVLDSGTSLTYLPDSLYQTLTAALVQAIDLPLLAFAQTEGHFCYNLGDGRLPWPRARYLFPDLTLTFGTGARMVLPPENYILLLATTAGFEVPCIAWQSAGPDSSLAVLGDLALRNLLVEFDVEANTVRWLPSQ